MTNRHLILILSLLAISSPSSAQLKTALISTPNPVSPAGQVVFLAAVTNIGSTTYSNLEARLAIPSDVYSLDEENILGDCPGSSCEPGETALFTRPELQPGATWRFMLPVTVGYSAEDGAIINNSLVVTHSLGGGPVATAQSIVATPPHLQVSLRALSQTGLNERDAIVQLTAMNRTSGALPSVTLSLQLPEGTTALSDLAITEQRGSELTWNLGTLAARATREIVAAVTLPQGVLLPIISASLSNGTYEASSAEILMAGSSAIRTALEALPSRMAPGDVVLLRASVSNVSSAAVSNVIARVSVPAEAYSFSESGTGGGCPGSSCEPGEVFSIALGALASGATRTFLMPTVLSYSAANLEPVVAAMVANSDGGHSASGHEFAGVAPQQNLWLAIESVSDGSQVNHRLVYSNGTGQELTGVNLVLVVPTILADEIFQDGFEAGDTDAWSQGRFASPTVSLSRAASTETIWNLGALAPGDYGSRTWSSPEAELGSLRVSGIIFDSTGEFSARAVGVTSKEEVPTLGVALAASPNPVAPAGQINYVATVTNKTAASIEGVALAIVFPSPSYSLNDSAISGDCPGSSCEPGELVTFNIGTLPAGQSSSVLLPVSIVYSASDNTLIYTTATATSPLGGGASTSSVVVIVDN